jgi:SAM-dependent methyltransferase
VREKEASTGLFSKKAEPLALPSPWFTWHLHLFRPGTTVLDLASGGGRHAVLAAERGSQVTAVDADTERLKALEREASRRRLAVKSVVADLATYDIPARAFDIVMIFNYLDRERMAAFREAVRPGGHLLVETFLVAQRDQGWGPESDDHLLEPGEILRLAGSFDVVLAREVLEVIDGRPAAVGSLLARRPAE